MNTENNKLIDIFMGLNPCDNREGYSSEKYTNVAGDIEYHKSWDLLMPVVEKIENTKWVNTKTFATWCEYPFTVKIESSNAQIIIDGGSIPTDPIHNVFPIEPIPFKGKSKLDMTYLVCLDFIKWYNTQPNKVNPLHTLI